MHEKEARLAHANELIRIIASHGRRFFFHHGTNRYDPKTKITTFVAANRFAYLELRNGRVYFVDDYTSQAIYTHRAGFGNKWRGFSHGGTLRALVEDMRDYIIHGTPIARWKIVIQRLQAKGTDDLEDNVWGYDADAARAVREAAYKLPIIESERRAAA